MNKYTIGLSTKNPARSKGSDMSIRIRKIYVDEETGSELEFIPASNIPGYAYRVVIDRQVRGWLADEFRPNIVNAMYFFRKHKEEN